MDAATFALAMALLAVVALVAAVVVIVGRVAGVSGLVPSAATALTGAFGIAAVATAGSLTFSEYYHFVPCELCWYQRIAMYPLAVVVGIAAWRRDLDVRRYVIPVAALGGLVSSWHVLVQRFPSIEGTSCDPTAPCTAVWVEPLGIFTIPTMALAGFVAIVALLATARGADERPEETP